MKECAKGCLEYNVCDVMFYHMTDELCLSALLCGLEMHARVTCVESQESSLGSGVLILRRLIRGKYLLLVRGRLLIKAVLRRSPFKLAKPEFQSSKRFMGGLDLQKVDLLCL